MKFTENDNPLDFDVRRDWNPELVAASLSKLCRYTGRCKYFYSVAQHSQLVAHIAGRLMHRRFSAEKQTEDPVSWYALGAKRAVKFFRVMTMAHLHDSMEHKIGDIATPVKRLPEFNRIRAWENEKLQEVYKYHEIDPTLLEMDIVSHADKLALSYEVMELMDYENPVWTPHLQQFPVTTFDNISIERRTPDQDERAWLEDYYDFMNRLTTREAILV